ncbi:MAG: hypothetical protein R6U32_01630 [Candidatus Woesearchaeota archaeon]
MNEPIKVLISGTGSMGDAFAAAIKGRDDIELADIAFTGDDVEGGKWDSGNGVVDLVKPKDFRDALKDISGTDNLVAMEFAEPGTNNTPLFAEYGIPWVSGTTKVNKEELAGCGVYDVNMAVPLIVLGNALSSLSDERSLKRSPGALEGFKGWFAESHQLYKADPSGTRGKWITALRDLGADLEEILPERLEPEGHGYHKVNMHSDIYTGGPLLLWAAVLEYAAKNFRNPFEGFDCRIKCRDNDDARPFWNVMNKYDVELGVRSTAPHPSDADTKGAQIANAYLTMMDGGSEAAAVNFYFNAHEKRGTNAGFETRVNGRGLYQPGIIAAVRHVHDRHYNHGVSEGIEGMMDVIRK